MTGTYEKKVWDSLDLDYQNQLVSLKSRIDADWDRFQNEPKWLFNEQLKLSGIKSA